MAVILMIISRNVYENIRSYNITYTDGVRRIVVICVDTTSKGNVLPRLLA